MNKFKDILMNSKIAIFKNNNPFLINDLLSLNVKEIILFSKKKIKKDNILQENFSGLRDIRNNNADILFLDSFTPLAARKFRYIGQAKYIFISIKLISLLCFIPGFVRYVMKKRLQYISLQKIGNQHWLIYKNVNVKYSRGPRYWLKKDVDYNDFFKQLSGLNYSLLRWYDQIDQMTEKDDLDILVSDEDLPKLIDILDNKIGTKPVDIYTISGHNNHGVQGIAYFPPNNSIELLNNTARGMFDSKNPNHQLGFLSYLYHLIYHKKMLSFVINEDCWGKIHYYHELLKLAKAANIDCPNNLAEADKILKKYNWQPPQDTISVYAKNSKIIEDYYFENEQKLKPGLSVFILREIAQKYNLIDESLEKLKIAGFEILHHEPISNQQKSIIEKKIRGGNWHSPEDREQEGGPAHLIVLWDKKPQALKRKKLKKRYPRLDNSNLLIKRQLRDYWAKKYNKKHFNAIHATDNSHEALDYISIIKPDIRNKCLELIDK